jgi:hypothetical protein
MPKITSPRLPIKEVSFLYDEDNNNYVVASKDHFGGHYLKDFQKTAFNELLVGQLYAEAQVMFPYGINSGQVNITGSISGRWWGQDGMVHLNAPSTGSYAYLASKDLLKYDPGMGGLTRFTTIYTSGQTGTKQLMGIGDRQDGFFFGYSGQNFGIMRLRGGQENWTYQSNWNGDTFLGTGESEVNLDHTKGNVYQIKYQWLGFGRVSFYVEDPNDGRLRTVHDIKYANQNTIPSVFNPTLPISMYVENSGNSNFTGTVLKSSSMAAFSEGVKNLNLGVRNSETNTATISTVSKNNIISIKNDTVFGGIDSRIIVNMQYFTYASNGNKSVNIYLIKNGNPGTNYSYLNSGVSPILFNTGQVPVTGGDQLITTVLATVDGRENNLAPYSINLYPGESLSVASALVSVGGSSEVSSSLGWNERF